jgi:hypothetical protein
MLRVDHKVIGVTRANDGIANDEASLVWSIASIWFSHLDAISNEHHQSPSASHHSTIAT